MSFIQRLGTFPYHIAGVIIFFITHGYSEYVGLIPLLDMLGLLVVLLIPAAVLFWLFRRKFKSSEKAGLPVTLILAFYLFYGAVADTFVNISFLHVLSRYRYLIPAFLVVLILLYIYLKRSAGRFQRVTLYLNTVFLFFILYDCIAITIHAFNSGNGSKSSSKTFLSNYRGRFDKKPDIYFILLDEYSGSRALATYFHYDNRPFEQSLRDRGFFVASTPSSNYTSTPFSIASTLSMNCLPWLPRNNRLTAADFARAGKDISNNDVTQFLQSNGYELYNYSIFDIGDQPTGVNTGLLSFKLKLITAKTLWSRIQKDLFWNVHMYIAPKFNRLAEKLQGNFREGIKKMMNMTLELSAKNNDHPKFVYTHLMMPHAPFLYDSSGAAVHINSFDTSIPEPELNKAYLQYLVYTNKVMNKFIEDLLNKTNRQAVIVLMSDHGYRDMKVNDWDSMVNNNFNAVYIPGQDYRFFYDSISNVNEFRALFNTLYDLKLPLLPDPCKCY